MFVLGFTGTFAAGKDTASAYVRDKFGERAYEVSTGNLVREETAKRGLSLARENLQVVSNEMRLKFGAGIFGKMTIDRINTMSKAGKDVFIVSGIRTVGEVEELQTAFGKKFTLIAIDAPIETRYERIKQRARAGEQVMSFADFKKSQEFEMHGTAGAHSQNIGAVMQLADVTIQNNGTPKQFEKKIEQTLKKLKVV